MNRSKRSYKTIISGNQPVIEWYLFYGCIIDLTRAVSALGTMLNLAHEHQISICFYYFIIMIVSVIGELLELSNFGSLPSKPGGSIDNCYPRYCITVRFQLKHQFGDSGGFR